MSEAPGPIRDSIIESLRSALSPTHLEVHNESGMHNVPPGSETHFKVVVVAESFVDKSLIARHREVNRVLAPQLAGPVHALSVHAYAPDQWQRQVADAGASPESPPCLGGSKA